jgi:hypothetical protein
MTSMSNSLTHITVNGVVTNVQFEYTSTAVANQFNADLAFFVALYQNILTAIKNNQTVQPPTAAQAAQLQSSLAALINLATYGQQGNVVPNDPNSPVATQYLNIEMATQLDLLTKTLESAGVTITYPPNFGTPNGPQLTTNNITFTQFDAQTWQDLAVASPVIQKVLSAAQTNATIGNRSLQALVELVYVKAGNQTIGDALASLQSALSTTNNVVNTLTTLQSLHNQVQVVNPSSFFTAHFNPNNPAFAGNSGSSLFLNTYSPAASAFFGKPLVPVLNTALQSFFNGTTFTPGAGYISAVDNLITLRNDLQLQISALSKTTPKIPNPANPNQQMVDPASLLGQITTVYNNIVSSIGMIQVTNVQNATPQSAFNIFKGFQNWMLDNYSQTFSTTNTLAGVFQQNLTNAITAAESLNSTEQDKVNNYLFVFQEYYQSAASMLSACNSLITNIANQMSRS